MKLMKLCNYMQVYESMELMQLYATCATMQLMKLYATLCLQASPLRGFFISKILEDQSRTMCHLFVSLDHGSNYECWILLLD